MTKNKTIALIGGTGLAGAVALAAALYSPKEEPAVAVKTPEECTAEFTAKASEAGKNIKLEDGQSIITLTTNPELKKVAQGLKDCMETYANSQSGLKFGFGQ